MCRWVLRHRLGRSGSAGGEEDAVHVPGLDRFPRGNEPLRRQRLQHVVVEDCGAEVTHSRLRRRHPHGPRRHRRGRPTATTVRNRPHRHALQPTEQGAVRDHELRIGQSDHVLQDRTPVGWIHRRADRAEHHEPQHEPHHHGTVVQPDQDPVAALHPERLERGGGAAGDVPGVGVRPGIAAVEHHQRANRRTALPAFRGCRAERSVAPRAARASGSAGAGSSCPFPGTAEGRTVRAAGDVSGWRGARRAFAPARGFNTNPGPGGQMTLGYGGDKVDAVEALNASARR